MDESLFKDAPDITPQKLFKGMKIFDLIRFYGGLPFEARALHRGASLFRRMIEENDTIWLGIAGAGIAGGMGGMIISLIEAGHIDVICSTGAQIYHDLHFAFALPVKAVSSHMDDDALRERGDTRIYDIGIREKETLEEQDNIIRAFIRDNHAQLNSQPLSSWQFNYQLGKWASKRAQYPERSYTIAAAAYDIPIFWDSMSNHSIAMNLARTDREGYPVTLSAQNDIIHSAAIVLDAARTGFIILGGGGPKNFIQQTGPTLSQILDMPYDGAERGLQISTANEREGSLSGCTFGEGVTWGKYRTAGEENLVQIWGEYSIIFLLLAAYVIDQCEEREQRHIISHLPDLVKKLESEK
jgi:deoxyhypusine synthase